MLSTALTPKLFLNRPDVLGLSISHQEVNFKLLRSQKDNFNGINGRKNKLAKFMIFSLPGDLMYSKKIMTTGPDKERDDKSLALFQTSSNDSYG